MSQVRYLIEYPPGKTESFPNCGKNLMLDLIAAKANQSPGNREDIFFSFRQIHSQVSPMFFTPIGVEVTDHRKSSMVILPELIQVSFVIGSHGVDRHMNFIILQT